jgi:hypothetical protein
MANHTDPRTTKLYDRRKDLATHSEIEMRIAFEQAVSDRRGASKVLTRLVNYCAIQSDAAHNRDSNV